MGTRAQDPVGRQPELARLGEALDELDRGTTACIAVEGEPGIGKTRLLEALRDRAQDRRHLVLAGSAAEFESDLPYGVWADALDAYVASQDLHARDGVDAELLRDLAGVLPSLRADGAARGDERHRVQRAFRALVELIAGDRPLVLVLDDLHWSDAASIDVLVALLRRPPAGPVLLALGCRSGKAPARLAAALGAPSVTIVELGPLGEADCSALTGERLDAAQRAAIYEQCGGNPFYTLQLAQVAHAPARSAPGDRLALDAGVPRVVAAALLEELDELSPAARALLSSGAIAGDPFEPELGYAIAELDAAAGVAALDELLDARLLRPTDVPRRFAFRHPLVRRAVHESTKGGWRLAAHARADRALAAQGASPAARAHHVEQSAARGDGDAIALLIDAGDADAPRAPASAARWYAAAVRLIPEDDPAARLRTLISLAQALRFTGDLERSAAVLLEAIELVPAGDFALRLRLTSACAACENFLGRHEPAAQRLVEALDTLPEQRSREAVTALLDLSAGAFFMLDDERMCDLTGRALAIAHGLGDPALTATAAAMHAHANAIAGRVGAARAHADEASAVLDALADDALARHLDAVNRLAWAEYLIERFDDSIRHAERGVAVARATGRGQFAPLMLGVHALSATTRGDLVKAAALQDEAVEAAELAANDYVSSSVLTAAAAALLPAGDLEAVRRTAEAAVACVAGIEGGRMAAMARARLAVTLRELGQSAAATEELVVEAGGWELPLVPPTWQVLYMETLTRVEVDGGRPGDACAAVAETTAAGLGLPLATALAQRARARVLLAGGRAPEAAELALASAAGAAAIPATVEAARSRVLAGRAVLAAGDRTRAVELLRAAEHELDASGALRDRAEARRELRRLGVRSEPRGPSGATGGGITSLSRREREVAVLITERKTNKEVARELFLSEKTVESHLRNIFAKLGASSRVDVARAVERDQG